MLQFILRTARFIIHIYLLQQIMKVVTLCVAQGVTLWVAQGITLLCSSRCNPLVGSQSERDPNETRSCGLHRLLRRPLLITLTPSTLTLERDHGNVQPFTKFIVISKP